MNRIFTYSFSCTFLVTSFKNGTSRALRKKRAHWQKTLGRGGWQPPCPPYSVGPENDVNDIVPVSLLFSLNRFHTLLWHWHDNLFKIFKDYLIGWCFRILICTTWNTGMKSYFLVTKLYVNVVFLGTTLCIWY